MCMYQSQDEGRNSNQVMLRLPILFLQVFKEGFFEFNKELKTFMVKNTFKEKCPLYFTAMTRHSIVIEQYMEP